ncbi:protein phosphatase [Streptomyces sp. NP160]|uniref:protein-tyrosine phosphatase family protein n=1 Tax=Streptomyces sp. NP160 TaxID=2586637 RepID=UPI0011189D25|nr:protein phosphatase [Streptomyces sp. NP160]TNM64175.1 protein phosphatase [Streptomyces sp. NP160]
MDERGPWPVDAPGVVVLPSGRRVRGRGVRAGAPPPGLEPDAAFQCTWQRPRPQRWPVRWVRWPDFGLPLVPSDARAALHEAWERADAERVEISCGGGNGRTGTALAVLAVLDGVAPTDAVAWVREHYRESAVETPWQRWWVAR